MLSLKNLTAHPLTTLGGLVVGCLTAGLNGAAATFAQGGGVTDWKPYAAVAVSAAIPVVIGALLPDPGRASAPATFGLPQVGPAPLMPAVLAGPQGPPGPAGPAPDQAALVAAVSEAVLAQLARTASPPQST